MVRVVINMDKLKEVIRDKGIVTCTFNNVNVKLTRKEKVLPELVMNFVEDYWEREKRKNPSIFNGQMMSIEKLNLTDSTLSCVLGIGDYKRYIGTNIWRPSTLRNFDPANYMMALSSGCMCITKDNWIPFSCREKAHLNSLIWGSIPEGYPEPIDFDDPKMWIHSCSLREAKEEICNDVSIESLNILGGVYEQKVKNLYVACVIRINLTRKEIEERFTPNDEFTSLLFVKNTKEDIKEMLRRYDFTDHNLGKIFLYIQQFFK
jgi:hypothetical protein